MTHARNQDGFALIEVIVSAAVLAIIALAVLAGIDGATASTARERARAVAASLAEQDQERMRALRFDELTKLVGVDVKDASRNQSFSVDGVTYNVNSEVTFQADSGTTTSGCGTNPKQNDYLRVITTVTSAMVGKRVPAVKLESLVAPPVSGALVVKVVDAKNQPVSGVAVTTVATKTGRSYSGTTNDQGCVPFVGVDSGEHKVTISKAGYVDRTGTAKPERIATVTPSLVSTLTIGYDRAADLTVNVKTLKPGVAWTMTATGLDSKATAVSDNSAETNILRTYTPASPASTINVPKVFPFTTAYSFFTGTCAIQSPYNFDADYFSKTNPAAAVIADASKPTLQQTATVFQPSLNLRLRATSSNANTSESTSLDATSLKVFLYLQPVSGETCDSPAGKYKIVNWPTPTTGPWGTAPVSTKTRNWVVQDSTDFDPGVPFGTYKVCLQDGTKWWSTGMNGSSHYDATLPARTTTVELPPSNVKTSNWTSQTGAGC